MPSAKALPDTRNNDPAKAAEAIAENRYCDPCERIFINAHGKTSHDRLKHPSAAVSPSAADTTAFSPATAPIPVPSVTAPEKAVFVSTRAPSMRLVIKPEQMRIMPGKAGEYLRRAKGLAIQFQNGQFATADPKLIAYLEGDAVTALSLGLVDDDGEPLVYKDPRFPITSMRLLRQALG